MLVEAVSADGADEAGVGAVGVGQRPGQLVEVAAAHRAVAVALRCVLLVAVTVVEVKGFTAVQVTACCTL